MDEMRIGEVAERAGLRTSAIRYYERIGLLPRTWRVSGQRRYDDEVLIRLAGIQLAQQAGFTVAETKQLFFGFSEEARPSERWANLAQEKLAELDELIRRAGEMKRLLHEGIHCRCSSLEECALMDPAPRESDVMRIGVTTTSHRDG